MSDSAEATKRCTKCGLERPRTAFNRQSASRDGLQAWCRQCMTEAKRRQRQLLREPAPTVGPGEKWCRSCRLVKAASAFGPQAATSDGLQAYCKACFAMRYRRRRAAEGLLARPADIPTDHKFCRGCRQVLPLTEWARRAQSTDGYDTRCLSCSAKRNREYHLTRTYGLTPDEVDAILERQGGLCAICRAASAVHVDHDHATGKVRGMLCFRCNAALGQLDDNPATLLRATSYLLHSGDDRSLVEVHWAGRLAEAEYGNAS